MKAPPDGGKPDRMGGLEEVDRVSAPALRGENMAALITAAGMSSRMELFKPLLPLGNESIIERQIRTLRGAGCSPIVIVTGHRGAELTRHLQGSGVTFAHNEHYRDTQMLDSIKLGLRHLRGKCGGVVVTPVDVPLFSREITEAVMGTAAPAAIPTFQGRDGHPICLRPPLFGEILEYGGAGGLGGFLAAHASRVTRLETDDRAILPDVDTQGEYLTLLKVHNRITGGASALPEEQLALIRLMDRYGASPDVLYHGIAVAGEAVRIGRELARAGNRLDIPLLHRAGMLHDIARRFPDHAQKGAGWLRREGLSQAADIVACHHDLSPGDLGRLSEKVIVYYVDKITRGRQIVSLEERFRESSLKCTTEEARRAHKKRYDQALQAENLIRRCLQVPA